MQRRNDLTVENVTYQGIEYRLIKDPVSLEYYQLRPEQYEMMSLLDGVRSSHEIRILLQQQFPTLRIGFPDIQQLILDLHRKGLIISNRTGQGLQLLKRERERRQKQRLSALKSILYIKLPGFNPEPVFNHLYPLVKWMFSPIFMAGAFMLIVSSWILLGVQFEEFQRRIPEFQQFFGFSNVLLLWLTMGMAKVIHELAHGLSCRRFNKECHEIGIAFLVFSPCLYCDVSDSWMLPNKWKRILIASAGMFAEVFLSALALLAWWMTEPGLLHHLCLNVFFVSTLTTILFNANPLLRYDGYYILADMLEIPNLRSKADTLLRHTFARLCLGIELPKEPFMPQRRRLFFAMYSLLSALYRWFLVFAITLFLYHMLKPYGLQVLGVALGITSGVAILGTIFFNLYKVITMPRTKPIRIMPIAVTVLLLFGIGYCALRVPLPQWVHSPCYVEPLGIRHIYTTAAGTLESVHVRPGQRVQRGDVLIRQVDFIQLDRLWELKTAHDVQEIDVEMARARNNKAESKLATEILNGLRKQITDYEQRLKKLTIVAPCDGIVIEAPAIRKSGDTANRDHLRSWEGTPLDERNLGSYLSSRTHLLSIAPDTSYEAILIVDQADRNALHVNQPVTIRLDDRPGETFHGSIHLIADRHLEDPPPLLSDKFGGPLQTLTDHRGGEQCLDPSYAAIVHFSEIPLLSGAGIRGRARIRTGDRTAVAWLIRYLKQTVRFRM
jgi:putative peptide zinc metalloprotease protein